MTLLWAFIIVFVVASAMRGRRRDGDPVLVHPYIRQMANQSPQVVPQQRVSDFGDRAGSHAPSLT